MNLAKLLVRVYAHAVVVGGVHDLLREGVILLHCACFSIVMVPSRGFSYSLTPEMNPCSKRNLDYFCGKFYEIQVLGTFFQLPFATLLFKEIVYLPDMPGVK